MRWIISSTTGGFANPAAGDALTPLSCFISMNVLLFGATGMVGQGVLANACVIPVYDRWSPLVEATGQQHQKLKEVGRA